MRFKVLDSISSIAAILCGAGAAFTLKEFSVENLSITLGFAVTSVLTHIFRGEKTI